MMVIKVGACPHPKEKKPWTDQMNLFIDHEIVNRLIDSKLYLFSLYWLFKVVAQQGGFV